MNTGQYPCYLLEKFIATAERVAIVGAGYVAQKFYSGLSDKSRSRITAFIDNDEALYDRLIFNICIVSIDKIDADIFIICVASDRSKDDLRQQLHSLGVSDNRIFTYAFPKDYDYYSIVPKKYYKNEISETFAEIFSKELNWEVPQTYNEIINWDKINSKDSRRTIYADKIKVRDFVGETIGDQHLTKNYGIWRKAEDINFDILPNQFVLKCNHGSGMNIIVKDKSQINIESVCKQLNHWLGIKYGFVNGTFELHYNDIQPQILAEEYLEGVAENVYDYDIYCFHGEPKYIHCIKGCHTDNWQGAFYDTNWVRQPFVHGCPEDPLLAPRPSNLAKMLELSRKLSKDFRHVRVDWWDLPDGRVIFCEMTFTSWAGLSPFIPDKYDRIFGELILNRN